MGDETVDIGSLMPLSVSRRVSRLRKAISPYEAYGIGEVISAIFEEGIKLASGHEARVVWVPGLGQWFWAYNDPKTKILTPAFAILRTNYSQEKMLVSIKSPEFNSVKQDREEMFFHTEGCGWHTIYDETVEEFLYNCRETWDKSDAAS